MDSEDDATKTRRRSIRLGVGSVVFGIAALVVILALFVLVVILAAQQME